MHTPSATTTPPTSIPLKNNDMYIHLGDPWDQLKNYRIRETSATIVIGDYGDPRNLHPGRTLPLTDRHKLQPSPYSLAFRAAEPELSDLAFWLRDLASSHLRNSGSIEVGKLAALLKQDPRLAAVSEAFIERCLRGCVASDVFVPKSDKRKKDAPVMLSLSAAQADIESRRTFAGSLAGELSSLSERIRHLIRHTTSVGTYREQLLQALLRKHLPERYHVASGFILGCPRQIDLLIYDRVDYAPVFREGDLVVAHPESVRAVIEVKTNLTRVELRKSLVQIKQVSASDDCNPPFFKGIFAFESDLNANAIMQDVVDFYTDTDIEVTEKDDDDEFNWIDTPYHHLTSLCVLGKAFGDVRYRRDSASGLVHPVLYSISSATGLNAQVAHFLESLLAFLRFGGLKPASSQTISAMLGADTHSTSVGRLTLDPWGPYIALETGEVEAIRDIKDLRANVVAVEGWRKGEAWKRA